MSERPSFNNDVESEAKRTFHISIPIPAVERTILLIKAICAFLYGTSNTVNITQVEGQKIKIVTETRDQVPEIAARFSLLTQHPQRADVHGLLMYVTTYINRE